MCLHYGQTLFKDWNYLSINEAAGSNIPISPDVKITAAASGKGESKVLRNIRGIIFDFDGTLFDNTRFPMYLIFAYLPDILRIWRERLVRKRFEGRDFLTREKYYRAFFGVMGKACRRSPQQMRNWYFNSYMPRMVRVLKKHYKLRPGVKEFLNRLDEPCGGGQDNFPAFAIYSDYPFLKERMIAMGASISPRLYLYTPESFGAQKPAARPFQCIAKDMGIKPEEILVIGDRDDTDGCGAYNAGMRFLCLLTGRRPYFKLDPYRNYPEIDMHQAGPILPMYSATWDELKDLCRNHFWPE